MDLKKKFYPFPNCGYFQTFLRYVSTWTMLIESPPMSKKLSPKFGFSVQTRTWATAFKSSLARSKSSEQTYPERSSSEKLNVDFRLSSYLKLNIRKVKTKIQGILKNRVKNDRNNFEFPAL